MDSKELLLTKCREGFRAKLSGLGPEDRVFYGERMKYELGVIDSLHFNDYFLIVRDIVAWAKNHGIRVGPGRGSAAGSLVAYVLDITEINPIEFNLIFERFLNKDRVSAPDIDIDFESLKRGRVFSYIRKKYGEDHVAQIVNYSELGPKSLLQDLGKVLEIPEQIISMFSEMIPYGCKTLREAFRTEKRFEAYATKYQELFKITMGLEGCMRQTGKHAAGVIITKDTLIESLPILTDGTTIMTQWEKKALEGLNYLKMDILALKTLDIIDKALEFIGDKSALPNGDQINTDDQNVLREFEMAHSLATFQFETPGIRDLLEKIKPTSFADLYLINALDRPGAKDSADDFVRNRETGDFNCLGDERLRPILESTYGIVVYQEQVIRLLQEIGGFTASEADVIRRAISAKNPKVFENNREKFLTGAVQRGYEREWANGVFEIMKKSESYGFNKSHSVAYSMLGYQTMFMKVYYPLEYMTAALRWVPTSNQKKMRQYEREAERLNIRVLPVDINESKSEYTFDRSYAEIHNVRTFSEKTGQCFINIPWNGSIRRGLSSIPFVGEAGKRIEEYQPFSSFGEFYKRVPKSVVGSNVMKALIKAGCFDSLGEDRNKLGRLIDVPIKGKAKSKAIEGVVEAEQQQLM
jgi:DNA polymerase-3 subunit alpha